jgi:hypothetical protein
MQDFGDGGSLYTDAAQLEMMRSLSEGNGVGSTKSSMTRSRRPSCDDAL